MISIDGYFAGPGGDISWHNTDEEFGKFAQEQTGEFGTLIFGRTTYDMMVSYWSSEQGQKDDPIVARLMNDTPKIVFSKTLKNPSWENTKVFDNIAAENVIKWKESEGKPAAIFGSGEIVTQFANLGLIDEFRLMVNPVILGEGKKLFAGVKKSKLKLLKTRKFINGNILLNYSIR